MSKRLVYAPKKKKEMESCGTSFLIQPLRKAAVCFFRKKGHIEHADETVIILLFIRDVSIIFSARYGFLFSADLLSSDNREMPSSMNFHIVPPVEFLAALGTGVSFLSVYVTMSR